jgi:uncharacterized protein with PQ loop repeat
LRKYCITENTHIVHEDGLLILPVRLIYPQQRRSSIQINRLSVRLRYPPQNQVRHLLPPKLRIVLINSSAVLAVVVSGVLGFYLSRLYSPSVPKDSPDNDEIEISTLGQIFGWGCAVLYLGSRIPQVVKNFRRKSTDGLSLLFFLFACLGNITYVLSILSLSLDARYLFVNLSWLVGSAGTLMLDALVSFLKILLMVVIYTILHV